MGVGGIGGGFTPYTTALTSGPSAAAQTQEASGIQQASESAQAQTSADQASAPPASASRGQNLNIVV